MRIQKTLVVLFACAIGIVSCSPSNENTIQRKPENEALVKKYLDALTTGDTSAIEGFLADNYKSYGPKIIDSANREKAVAEAKTNWRSHWQSVDYNRYTMLSATLPEGPNAGDWVLDWGMVTIHSKDKTPSFTVQWHGAFRVKDGKITQEVSFFNEADIFRQLGYTFVPPKDSTAATK